MTMVMGEHISSALNVWPQLGDWDSWKIKWKKLLLSSKLRPVSFQKMEEVPRIQEEAGVESKVNEVLIQKNVGGTYQLCSECLASARRLGQLEDETEKAVVIVQV